MGSRPASTESTSALRVLHVDDDPFELDRVRSALEQHAFERPFAVTSVLTVADFQRELARQPPDVAILDIHIENAAGNGISLAEQTRQLAPQAVILMCSTADDLRTITKCLQAGADDFISKQSDRGELSLRVFNSYRLAKLRQGGGSEVSAAAQTPRTKQAPIGATMARIARRVPLIIDSAITAVFVAGESGTGKEVVANLFGDALPDGAPFIKVNCGAITPTLLESELFGHVRGAFTGANSDKRGYFEAAHNGWLFLDEVATLQPSAQVALLRVLENQEVLRVGSTKPISISVRVLSATNESLSQLVQSGKFRADLWQRLREAEIALPPLRERPDEIPALVEHFSAHMPGGPYKVSGPALEVLSHYSWSEGNVRELRNCLRAMTEMHMNKLLAPLAIPARIWDEVGEKPAESEAQAGAAAGSSATGVAQLPPVKVTAAVGGQNIVLQWRRDSGQTFDDLTDHLLLELTRRLAGESGRLSLRGLAQAIGMSRSTLSSRLKDLVHKNVVELAELSRLVGVSDGK